MAERRGNVDVCPSWLQETSLTQRVGMALITHHMRHRMINQPVELSIDEAIYFASTKTRAMGSGLECGLVHGGQTLLRIEERSRSPRVSRFRSKPPRLLDRSLGLGRSGGPPFFSVWNFAS